MTRNTRPAVYSISTLIATLAIAIASVAGAQDVGVIPVVDGICPAGSQPLYISMTDEKNNNQSAQLGWTGGITQSSTPQHVTRFSFCRVEGSNFIPHPRLPYAVLRLDPSGCPPGSLPVGRRFENERSQTSLPSSSNIAPNTSNTWPSFHLTNLYFCHFPPTGGLPTSTDPKDYFPDLQFSYGVFAPTVGYSQWIFDEGAVYTDDEDGWFSNPNRNRYFIENFGVEFDYMQSKDIPALGFSEWVWGERNTWMRVAKVHHPYRVWLAGFGTNGGWSDNNTYPRFVVDMDRDELPDVVGFASNGIYVAINDNGMGFRSETLWLNGFGTNGGWSDNNTYPRYIIDMNDDQYPDLVAFASNGIYVALNDNGTGFFADTFWLNGFGTNGGWSDNNQYPRRIVDVNDDGYPDLVGFASNGIYVALNNSGAGFSPDTLWLNGFGTNAGWSDQDRFPRHIIDMDGDSLADLVGFASNGIYVALNQGTGFGPAQLWLNGFGTNAGWASNSTYPRHIVDVNGDGFPDLVGFASNGIYVAGNQGGSGFSAARLWLNGFGTLGGWSDDSTYPRRIADVSNDGSPDLVAFASNGIYVALTGGGADSFWSSGFVTHEGWINNNSHPRQVIDMNGDSLPDVIGFADDGVYVQLNNGSRFH